MSEELKWHEALEMLRADPDARVRADGLAYRMQQDGDLEVRDNYPDSAWVPSVVTLTGAMTMKWRRVPKAPSLGELAAGWRDSKALAPWQCASELDAALRDGEWVNLRGVTVDELWRVFRDYDGAVQSGLQAVLEHLRDQKVTP